MTPEQRPAAFDDFDPEAHAAEAEKRWGSSPAYVQSTERTRSYTAEDWERERQEASDLDQRFLGLIDAGISPDSTEAALLVDAYRAHITRWFYDCTPEIHAGLGVMYAADPRFADHFNGVGDGLAAYLSAAITTRYVRPDPPGR